MVSVKVINHFTAERQAQEAKTIVKDGKELHFPARPASVFNCALVELQDGSGHRITVELPQYKNAIDINDMLMVDVNLSIFDRMPVVRNITRHIPAKTK